jgi:BirA family biotin operon repressor/biotin-[acetyl-CoA-carboxylase] ligase
MRLEAFQAPEGYFFEYLSETSSTSDDALARGAGAIVCAGRQTGGRGRLGRSFSSEEGGLYFSMAVKPPCELAECLFLPIAAAVCVRDAVGGDAKIKWPNDILLAGKKICGILTESREGCVVFGIGVNIANALPDDLPQAGRVAADPQALLTGITHRLAQAVRGYPANRAALLKRYADNCLTLGKTVDVTVRGEKLRGLACGLDENGALRVKPEGSNETVTVASGEATLAV